MLEINHRRLFRKVRIKNMAVNNDIKAIWLDETHLGALMEFKEACGEDWDDVVNFEPEDVEDYKEYFVGLMKGDEIIGMCTVGGADVYDDLPKDDCLISDVIIKPSERGSGYGKLLIKEALKLADDEFEGREAHVVLLDSRLAEWYKGIGFEAEGTDEEGEEYSLKIKI